MLVCQSLCDFCLLCSLFFFFKQNTAYEVRISDWSSDVCSSDLNASIFARISKSDGQRPMSAHRVSEDGLSRHISREIRRDESRKLVRYISKHPVILRERL